MRRLRDKVDSVFPDKLSVRRRTPIWNQKREGDALRLVSVLTKTNKEAARLREVECPQCNARFRRARTPRVDSHGFESYELDCRFCGVSLAGIIDPLDGALLLSAMAQDSKSD